MKPLPITNIPQFRIPWGAHSKEIEVTNCKKESTPNSVQTNELS